MATKFCWMWCLLHVTGIITTLVMQDYFSLLWMLHDLLGVLPPFYTQTVKGPGICSNAVKTHVASLFIQILCFLSNVQSRVSGEHGMFIKALNCVQCCAHPQHAVRWQVAAHWLLPKNTLLARSHPVANMQCYLWPWKYELPGAAGLPARQVRAGWHGQHGVGDMQWAVLSSLLYKPKHGPNVDSLFLWFLPLFFLGPSAVSSGILAMSPACLKKDLKENTLIQGQQV